MDELEFWSLHWRQDRDMRLQACDWVVLSDVPDTTTDKAAWLEYRQALRDVPQQAGFPFDIHWPAEPALYKMQRVLMREPIRAERFPADGS